MAMARRYLGTAGGDRYVADNLDLAGERGFRTRRSIGSFKIRAKDTPGSAAPGHHPSCGTAGHAPLLPQERTLNNRHIGGSFSDATSSAYYRT
jgi:hypothetical protein